MIINWRNIVIVHVFFVAHALFWTKLVSNKRFCWGLLSLVLRYYRFFINFKTIDSKSWFCYFNRNTTSRFYSPFNLLLLLFQSFWQNITINDFLFLQKLLFLFGKFRNSNTICIFELLLSMNHSWVVILLELTLLFSCATINVVSKKLLIWICWLDVTFSICVKSWFTKVGSERRICKPSSRGINLRDLSFKCLFLSS